MGILTDLANAIERNEPMPVSFLTTTSQQQESTMEKTSKAAQVAGLRVKRANAKGPKPGKTAKAKKPAKKAVRKAKKAAPGKSSAKVDIKPGSKLEIISGLLKRPGGCTAAEVCAATGWAAVSVPPIGKRLGIKLKKEKVDGAMRYSEIPAAA